MQERHGARHDLTAPEARLILELGHSLPSKLFNESAPLQVKS